MGLALLIATCVFSIQQVRHQRIRDAVEVTLKGVRELLQMELDEEAQLQSGLLKFLETDETLQTHWLNRDRAALLNHVQPILERILSDHRITHFYFIDTNRVCFLRIHNPDRYGDTIPRLTLAAAVQNYTEAHGIELGTFGTLTFRSVLPWHLDGRLIGYVELGQEIGHIEDELSNIIDVDIAITVYKSCLDSVRWVEGNRMLGRVGDWGQYDDFVVTAMTAEHPSDNLDKCLAASHNRHQHTTVEMEHAGRPYLARSLALIDAGGRKIGDILVLKDVSAEMSALRTLTIITIVAGFIVGAMLFVLFYIILGRIEAKLERTRTDWMAEIDERKRVTEELASHNEFMQNVFESLTHPFYVLDAKSYQVLMGNTATGLPMKASEITCHELTHQSSKPCSGGEHPCPLTEAHRTKKPVTVEHIHYDKNGNARHVEVHGYPILDRNGEVIQLIEYTLDITDRKYAQKALMESRAHSRMIIETAGDAFIAIDAKGIVIDWNRKAEEVFGWLSGEAIGKPLTNLIVPPDQRERHKTAFDHYLQTGQGPILNKRIEVTALHKNGLTFPVEMTVWATGSGEELQFNAFISDISEKRWAEDRLRESQKRYQDLFDSVMEGIGIVDADEMIEFCNPAYARIFDVESPSDLVGHNILDYVPEDEKQNILNQTERRRQGESAVYELRIVTAKGTTKTLLASVLPRFDDGQYTGAIGTILDITERKQAEEQLRKSEEQFRNLFEQSNDAILIHTMDGRIIEANQRSSEMLGYDREKLLTLPIRALHPDSERDTVERAFATTRKQGSVQFQSKFRREDGSVIDVEISARILDEKHDIIQGVVRDISERVRQVSELRKLSAAVEQSANLICISDPDGIIEYVNPEFCRVSGYSSSEAVGQRTNLLASGRHDDAFYSELWRDISSGRTWSNNIRNRKRDGELFWARLTITPIFNADNEIINYLAITEDITKEIIAQQRLVESDKLSAVGTLAAGVAHEFKNYLAGIIGNASFALSILKDEDGMEAAQDSFEQIVELGERANSVAMSLLTYSKAEPDAIAPEDLRSIIENTIRIVDKEIRNQSIEVLTHFEDLPPVMVSASKIQQVLLNLLINAQHAIDGSGVITVGLVREGDHAVIKVSDTGKGIPAAHLSSIFDPFFSTKGVWGKDAVAGTGMGLSISRNIAREHRGDLTVESIVGIGTTFSLHLPLDSTKLPTASRGHTCSCHRLMLQTTDQNLAEDYQRQADDSGYQLRVVEDIDEVMDGLNTIVDIVICDGNFPRREQLFRMFEVCHKYDVRCVVVNIGTSGCRNAIPADAAVVCFEETPALPEIIQPVQEVAVDKSSA